MKNFNQDGTYIRPIGLEVQPRGRDNNNLPSKHVMRGCHGQVDPITESVYLNFMIAISIAMLE